MRFPTWAAMRFRYLRPWMLASLTGTVGALVVSALLVPARDWMGNTNIALVLVAVVVAAAAYGGRAAGVLTAFAASVTFNATHTVPYGTLVIENREDIITTVLVAVVGVAVGELTHLRVEAAHRARRRDYAVSRIHRVAELVRHAADPEDVLTAIDTELGAELGTRAVELIPGPPTHDRVQLTHAGVIDGTHENQFPPEGVDVSVNLDGEPAFHLRLHPDDHQRVTDAGCIVAVVMADLLGFSLHRSTRRSGPT